MKNINKFEKELIKRLKLRHLVLLVEIDRYQNVLKAARSLSMTQPAASRMLLEVEDILGITLFERGPRGVSTTAYGNIMVQQAKQLVGGLRHAVEEIASLRDGISGHVSIGTLLAAAPALVPNAVTRLKSTHPQVLVNIVDGTNEELLAAVDDEAIHLAVTRMEPYILQNGLTHEVLYEDRMCIAARVDHPKAGQKNIALSELADYQWILPGPQTLLRELFDRIFASEDVKPPSSAVVESVSLHLNLSLMLKSDMLTFLPFHAVKPYISMGLLTRLDAPIDSSFGPIGVTYKDISTLSPASRIMLECLRKDAGMLS